MESLFKGWTRDDGVREHSAPRDWPFGRLDVQAQQLLTRAAATADYHAARALFLKRVNRESQ